MKLLMTVLPVFLMTACTTTEIQPAEGQNTQETTTSHLPTAIVCLASSCNVVMSERSTKMNDGSETETESSSLSDPKTLDIKAQDAEADPLPTQ